MHDGTVISYVVLDGGAPDVVLLHGLAGSGREMLPTARALAGRRVLVVDQRGHGGSTRRPDDLSREAFVDDVVQVVLGECTGPVDLVGQSMGAHTAMLVAAARPDLVRRLVLLECHEGGSAGEERPDDDALKTYFASWPVPFADRASARQVLGDGPLARAWVADLEERPDGLHPRFDAAVVGAVARTMSTPRRAEWASVEAPTLVVYADGGMFTEEQKRSFVAAGRRARRADLTGASHDAHLDAFDQWARALSTFLAEEVAP